MRPSSSWALLTLSLLPAKISCFETKYDQSVTLRIVHITDVYTLENFPSLVTLIDEKRQEHGVQKTISLLSGDFLMPYLLSSVDGGKGMMRMLNEVPVDYLTWGNHEKDLPHHHLLEREREFKGVWINTNMQSHESFQNSTCQVDFDVIKVRNGDHVRKIALLGILTNSRSLYPPGSFNGAIIEDPWVTMSRYNDRLKHAVDLVLPICHLYEIQDERTAAEFDFPLILGGHDHHPVDRTINGTRVLKPGADAHFARVIDITWDDRYHAQPSITSELLTVNGYAPNPHLQIMAEEAYRVLDPLRQTQLGVVPEVFRPLSSKGARSNRVSVATFFSTIIRDALQVDAFVAKGGNIRGSRDYEEHEQFTLELLQSELENVDVYIAQLPGDILRGALRETWTQPGTGWFQHDVGIVVDSEGLVVSVNGEPLDPNRMYVIATLEDWFRPRDGPSIGRYYEENPEQKPAKGLAPVYTVILRHMAQQSWQRLFTILDVDSSGSIDTVEFDKLDLDRNGYVNRHDIMATLGRTLGLQTFPGEYTFVDFVLTTVGAMNSTLGVPLEHLNKVQSRRQSSPHLPSGSINDISIGGCELPAETQ
jgi:2',3'-cyclic-nucleotide 2'-phosphodiesterase (5'-nucleotidase family)